MMKKAKKAPQVTLTGAVYCDWNAFDFVAPLPDAKYWKAGDLVVWSWSGDSKSPSSRSHDGLFAVSVVTDKRSLRRSKLKVKRTRVHRNLPFSSERDREEQLRKLVTELQGLQGRVASKARFGYEVQLPDPPAKAPAAVAAAPAPSTPSAIEPPTLVRRGRVKPGIRSEAPGPAPQVVAIVVAVIPVKPARRRRRKPVDPRQGVLL